MCAIVVLLSILLLHHAHLTPLFIVTSKAVDPPKVLWTLSNRLGRLPRSGSMERRIESSLHYVQHLVCPQHRGWYSRVSSVIYPVPVQSRPGDSRIGEHTLDIDKPRVRIERCSATQT